MTTTTPFQTVPSGIYLDPKPREQVRTEWLGKHIAVKPQDDAEQIGVLMLIRMTDDWQGEQLSIAAQVEEAMSAWRTFIFSGPDRNIEYVRGPRTEHWIATASERASRPPRARKDGETGAPRQPRTRRTLQMKALPDDLPLDQLYMIADAVTGEQSDEQGDEPAMFGVLTNATDEPLESFAVADLIDPEAIDALNAKLVEQYGEGPLPEEDDGDETPEDSFGEEFPHIAAQAAEALALDALMDEAEDEAEDEAQEERREIDPDAYQPSPDDDEGLDGEQDENTLSPAQEADAKAAMMAYAAQQLKQPRRKSTSPRSGAKRGK